MTDTLIAVGNHGKDIAVVWERVYGDSRPLYLYDDDLSLGHDRLPPNHGRVVIGVNDPVVRRQLASRFKHLRGTKPLIDPSAIIGPNVSVGFGSVVSPGAILLHSVTLGSHVHANYNASMTRCVVGDFTTIAPAATICGNVVIGEECIIGAGAVVCERTKIGSGVIVGAGGIVPPYSTVPDCTTIIGVWKE